MGDICISDVRAVVATDVGGMLKFRYQESSSASNLHPYRINIAIQNAALSLLI